MKPEVPVLSRHGREKAGPIQKIEKAAIGGTRQADNTAGRARINAGRFQKLQKTQIELRITGKVELNQTVLRQSRQKPLLMRRNRPEREIAVKA